ncbi:ribosome silencing factor [Candidatus Schmidhempelia bombi]
MVDFIIDKLEDLKAQNIVKLDVRNTSSITDFMIICTATSSRHVISLSDHLIQEAKQAGLLVLGNEGKTDADWVVVDCDSVMIHVMQQESRERYQLEKLWS